MSQEQLEYKEVGHMHRQTVRVTDNEVLVSGNITMSGEYEHRTPLSVLSPRIHTTRMRGRFFQQYLACMWVSIAIAFIYHAIPGTTVYNFAGGLITFLPLTFLVASAATIRKFQTAYFSNDNGTAVFSVSQLGPQRADFDRFVANLQRRIEQARSSP
jgi:hypothetical protein